MVQSKINNFTYEDIKNELGASFYMPTDNSDAVRSIVNKEQFERARKELTDRYGDVLVRINKEEAWFKQVEVLDKTFKEEQAAFMKAKGEWCRKYGSN